MIVLGIILLLIGYFTSLSILYTIGGILVVVGVVLWILGAVGKPVGGIAFGLPFEEFFGVLLRHSVLQIILFTIDKHDHVGVLLDRS